MPTSSDLYAPLRVEVGRFRERERRRRFDLAVHVGTLGGDRSSVTVPTRQREHVDRQVRVDLVSALLELAPEAGQAWLTRPGPPELDDDDVAWMVAAEAAFGASGLDLDGFYAITRYGWVDARTGERRVWKRLRLNR